MSCPLVDKLTTVSISPTFWKNIASWKLDIVKTMPVATKTIYAYFNLGRQGADANLRIDETSFEPTHNFHIQGRIELYDTLEAFQGLDVKDVYNKECDQLHALLKKGDSNNITSEKIFPFVLIAHCDLKKYVFSYHFILPTLYVDDWEMTGHVRETFPIEKTLQLSDGTYYLADPSPPEKLAWFLQNLVVALFLYKKSNVSFSICKQGMTSTYQYIIKPFTGITVLPYDSNRYSKTIDLAKILNPSQLSKEVSELNLRLMKWRIVPELNLEIISNSKCLLIGAGTLGCSVARSLLGWNVKTITFVDCGTVSFSNPVRQSLFTFKDAKDKKSKAIAAAERLKEIDPNVNAIGFDLQVPMPGHYETVERVNPRVEQLENLIKSHDVIFLLTDSKEARWLPSVLSTMHQKIAITVALGFDSFVVQRHGLQNDNLSCYFCHDVVGPVDSMSNRSLDQQCTVTRPGLSGIASGMAVELLTSLLQIQSSTDEKEGVMGSVPHQIRGHLSTFEVSIMTGHRHSNCPSCGTKVQEAAKENLISLVQGACNNAKFLEKLCGLDQIKERKVQSTKDDFEVILD